MANGKIEFNIFKSGQRNRNFSSISSVAQHILVYDCTGWDVQDLKQRRYYNTRTVPARMTVNVKWKNNARFAQRADNRPQPVPGAAFSSTIALSRIWSWIMQRAYTLTDWIRSVFQTQYGRGIPNSRQIGQLFYSSSPKQPMLSDHNPSENKIDE